jgi:hypothetical protein
MQTQTLDQPEYEQVADTSDSEWGSCDDDFVTQIPDYLEIMSSASDGMRSPGAKDYLGNFQITAEGW